MWRRAKCPPTQRCEHLTFPWRARGALESPFPCRISWTLDSQPRASCRACSRRRRSYARPRASARLSIVSPRLAFLLKRASLSKRVQTLLQTQFGCVNTHTGGPGGGHDVGRASRQTQALDQNRRPCAHVQARLAAAPRPARPAFPAKDTNPFTQKGTKSVA